LSVSGDDSTDVVPKRRKVWRRDWPIQACHQCEVEKLRLIVEWCKSEEVGVRNILKQGYLRKQP
jgi:hypothetical protein